MNFSTDRDLLMYEPSLFEEASFLSQQRLQVADAATTGATLTSATADFTAAQVDKGGVVLLAQKPCEVLERLDSQTLTVSLLRRDVSGDAIAPGDGQDQSLIVRTFSPQAGLVHAMLLRMLGMDVDDPQATVHEQAIMSRSLMRQLEVLGTLERVYGAAASLTVENGLLLHKASMYRRRFLEACRGAVVLLDTTGDGRVDERRVLGLMRLRRT